jgi:hypothetical protein
MTPEQRKTIVATWEDWRRALYEERAAIHQFCSNVSVDEAERMAFDRYKPEQKKNAEQRWLDL